MNDPRHLPDFDPSLYPQCDQGPAPSNSSAAAARKLEFLAAYYHINQAHRTLLKLRAEGRPDHEERAALQAIERALLARDALEDKYAPLGIVATPQFENGFIKDVSFVQPPVKIVASSLSMLFAVGPPPGIPAMKRWILRLFLSVGDVLMLTAAVRDLHRACPGEFVTDVRTPFPDLWENNPYLTPLEEGAAGVESIDCHYPLIHHSNSIPFHFIHGFMEFLSERVGTRVRPTAFKGDIHLSPAERDAPSRIAGLIGCDLPYWILVAGGKYDYTIKWWHFRRYQQVIDRLRDRVLFVQVGASGHYHPELSGVIDLRGKCSIRDLVHLVYHAQGVLCPVTFLMHLAAAVEMKGHPDSARPCVVVAGGREPPQWEAYTAHQFIHTIGALPCCARGGCWRSRTVPLGDGDEKDQPGALCQDVVGGLPRCMDMITAEEVVRRIELFFTGGQCRYLTASEARKTQPYLTRTTREQIGI